MTRIFIIFVGIWIAAHYAIIALEGWELPQVNTVSVNPDAR